jgi:hypothetical protein
VVWFGSSGMDSNGVVRSVWVCYVLAVEASLGGERYVVLRQGTVGIGSQGGSGFVAVLYGMVRQGLAVEERCVLSA